MPVAFNVCIVLEEISKYALRIDKASLNNRNLSTSVYEKSCCELFIVCLDITYCLGVSGPKHSNNLEKVLIFISYWIKPLIFHISCYCHGIEKLAKSLMTHYQCFCQQPLSTQ